MSRKILNRKELRDGIDPDAPPAWEEDDDGDECSPLVLECWIRETDQTRFEADMRWLFDGHWDEAGGDGDGDIVDGWVHHYIMLLNVDRDGFRQGFGPVRMLDYIVPGNGQPYPPTQDCTTLKELVAFLQEQPWRTERPDHVRQRQSTPSDLETLWARRRSDSLHGD